MWWHAYIAIIKHHTRPSLGPSHVGHWLVAITSNQEILKCNFIVSVRLVTNFIKRKKDKFIILFKYELVHWLCWLVAYLIFVLPALARKTHRDHFVHCCYLLLLWKQINIWLYLLHALMDVNQSLVIDATWEPSYVNEVKSRILRSKVTFQGQRSSEDKL